jgi:hypothetical protein
MIDYDVIYIIRKMYTTGLVGRLVMDSDDQRWFMIVNDG